MRTVIAIDAVPTPFVTQVRMIPPMLGAGPPRQNRCLVLRALRMGDQLGLIACLFETLPMLHGRVLEVAMSHLVLVEHLHVVKVLLVYAGHHAAAGAYFLLLHQGLLLFGPLRLDALLLADDPSDRRPIQIVRLACASTGGAGGGRGLLGDAGARLAHVLRLVQVLGQLLDLARIHRDLGDVLLGHQLLARRDRGVGRIALGILAEVE